VKLTTHFHTVSTLRVYLRCVVLKQLIYRALNPPVSNHCSRWWNSLGLPLSLLLTGCTVEPPYRLVSYSTVEVSSLLVPWHHSLKWKHKSSTHTVRCCSLVESLNNYKNALRIQTQQIQVLHYAEHTHRSHAAGSEQMKQRAQTISPVLAPITRSTTFSLLLFRLYYLSGCSTMARPERFHNAPCPLSRAKPLSTPACAVRKALQWIFSSQEDWMSRK
jgi:hypothetical protein